MTERIVLVDGQAVDRVDVTDRGFQFGDGVFETLRVRAGRPRFVGRHLTRCASGCARLGIPLPDRAILLEDIGMLSRRITDGVVKLLVTRGSSERGYGAPEMAVPRRVALAWPTSNPVTANYRVRLCETRLASQPLLAGIKHLNRLEQVLARGEWNDADIHEGLLMDYHGNLIEGTMSNLFLVRGGGMLTPDLANCGVAGVLRSVVMDAAAELGIEVVRARVGLDDLHAADEVFMCNALTGVRPVTEWIEQASYPVGRITTNLQAAVARLAGSETNCEWYSR